MHKGIYSEANDRMSLAAAQTNWVERRNAPRRTAFGRPVVQIRMVDREALMACVVDISRTGARLLFAAGDDVPAVFTIDFDIPRQAQVVWRKDAFIGVKFTDAK